MRPRGFERDLVKGTSSDGYDATITRFEDLDLRVGCLAARPPTKR